MRTRSACWVTSIALMSAPLVAGAEPAARVPEVEVEEHLGQQIPPSLTFRDEQGEPVTFGSLLSSRTPILLVVAYYRCPMLCGLVLGGVARTLGQLDWRAGGQFRVVTISFDPEDSPETARQRKRAVLASTPEVAADAWPFWTGRPESIAALLAALGVRVEHDARTRQYAHPAVFFALTPDGRVSRYLYGFDAPPRDVKLALLEASDGRTGSAFERVLLRCYAYDPATRRYGLFITRLFRYGGIAILGVTTLGLVTLFRRQAKRAAPSGREGGRPDSLRPGTAKEAKRAAPSGREGGRPDSLRPGTAKEAKRAAPAPGGVGDE